MKKQRSAGQAGAERAARRLGADVTHACGADKELSIGQGAPLWPNCATAASADLPPDKLGPGRMVAWLLGSLWGDGYSWPTSILMYWARSKASGSACFFWLRMPFISETEA